MFTGHYAPAFVLHRRFPDVPLWQLFLGAQAVDVLFWGLVAAGVERMHVDPTAEGSLGLVLEFMPYSHSLVAAGGWGLATAVALRGERRGIVLAVAVASHWLCDLPMHLGDLPLAAGDGARVGLGLWTWPWAAWALECGLVGLSVLGADRRLMGLAAGLIALQTLQSFVVPLPPDTLNLALTSEVSYLLLAAAAWKVGTRPGSGSAA